MEKTKAWNFSMKIHFNSNGIDGCRKHLMQSLRCFVTLQKQNTYTILFS
jgi:hypothetical protein